MSVRPKVFSKNQWVWVFCLDYRNLTLKLCHPGSTSVGCDPFCTVLSMSSFKVRSLSENKKGRTRWSQCDQWNLLWLEMLRFVGPNGSKKKARIGFHSAPLATVLVVKIWQICLAQGLLGNSSGERRGETACDMTSSMFGFLRLVKRLYIQK